MKTLFAIKRLAEDFVSLLFPKVCIHCGRPLVYQEEHLCLNCRLDLPKTNYHYLKDNPLEQKLIYEPKVHRAAAYLHYLKRGIAQSIIHNLKYKALEEVGQEVGRWYGEDLQEVKWPVDFIVPVPLHTSKLRKRGYNQSTLIAAGIAELLEVPVLDNLVSRVVRTKTQTRKTKIQRLQNVSSVYRIEDPEAFSGKQVILVDDVITTGATIGELASLIAKETSVKRIYVVALAAGE